MKLTTTKRALMLTLLLGSFAAAADGARPYTASPGYWNWVDGMNFSSAAGEPSKSAARPYTASDAYWTWTEGMNFAPAKAEQSAGRPYTASPGYWAWVDQMQSESQFVGTKAKAGESTAQ